MSSGNGRRAFASATLFMAGRSFARQPVLNFGDTGFEKPKRPSEWTLD